MAPPAAIIEFIATSFCRFRWLLLLSSLCCLLLSPVASSPFAVTHLPGFDGPLPFPLETGYVEIDESNGVHLFYYFVQSEKDPARDPLVLWMQGGPGCSGLSGLAYETGPLQFDVEGYTSGLPTLLYRPETWTKVSNVIFIDNPVGTGFSYATSKEGFESNDTMSVKQLVIFLKKGYFVGNPRTDEKFDAPGKIKILHGMGLISDELYQIAEENCKGNYSDPPNALCAKSVQDIDNCTKDINWPHVSEPTCEKWKWSPRIQQARASNRTGGLAVEYSDGADLPVHFKCRSDTFQLSYIWANDERVRKSLGVRKGTKGEWIRHDHNILYTMDITSTVETHLMLARKGYPALVYSGDHDAGFSFVGTQAWIRSLNLSITDDWRPWYVDAQVAGFTRSFSSNLTYATVKGGGHTAPSYKPKECLTMFARWISGDPL